MSLRRVDRVWTAVTVGLVLAAAAPAAAQFSGYYRIMARHSGKALVVQSASTANSANVVQFPYGGAATNDEWQISSITGGYWRIVNRNSGRDMVVQSASTAEGANIFQYAYGGANTNDEWALVDVGSGYHRITNRHSGKSAEVAGGSTADSAAVNQRTYSGASHQQFEIVSLTASPVPTATPTPTPPCCTATPTPAPTATPGGGGPTDGWTSYSAGYYVQRPYNLPVSSRFSYSGGIYTFWVYGTDQPFSQGSGTGPRTEARVDTWPQQTRENMWEGEVQLQTSVKYCLMQVKSNTGGEPVYIQVADPGYPAGTIRNGGGTAILATVGVNNWFRMHASYNPATGARGVWINGERKLGNGSPNSARDFYFKFGVYDNISGSTSDLSRDAFRNVRYWVK
jgi:hypothetical protein